MSRSVYNRSLLLGASLVALAACAQSASAGVYLLDTASPELADSGSSIGLLAVADDSAILLSMRGTRVVPVQPSTAAPRGDTPRNVELTVPLSENGAYLGDVTVFIAEDRPEVDAGQLADLLDGRASPDMVARLRALNEKGRASLDDLAHAGLPVVWDPGLLSLDISLSPDAKARRGIEVSDGAGPDFNTYEKPALFAVFANVRTALDYNHDVGSAFSDTGLQDPFFDIAVGGRIAGVAFDSHFTYDSADGHLRRDETRLVFDNEATGIRAQVGDVRPQTRGFQSGADIVGVSVFSAYQAVQPSRNLRPRGSGSFTLETPSTVDILVNGQVVRRLQLDSGAYDVSDFPFLDGQNRVQFVAEDRTGRRELADFDVFFTQHLLAKGLSDWSVSVGQTTAYGPEGPVYEGGKTYLSAHYTRGVSETLTVGGNVQSEGESGLAGLDTVWANTLGVLSLSLATSWSPMGAGNAFNLSFERTTPLGERGLQQSWALGLAGRSEFFGSLDDYAARNTESLSLYASWSRSLNDRSSLNIQANYIMGRDGTPDGWSLTGGYGRRLTPTIGLSANLTYRSDRLGDQYGVRLQLTKRFGRSGTVSASTDTRYTQTNVSAQNSGRSELGDWSVGADMSYAEQASGVNANGYLSGNRGEIGLSHSTTFDDNFSHKSAERTSLRLATGFGFADGAFAWGRPVYGAFAVPSTHKSLGGRTLSVASNGSGEYRSSALLGAPLVSNLPNYSRRDLNVDVEDLPLGYDLGSGHFTVHAPYNAGYKLTVGSADNLTITGRLLNDFDEPLAFVTGVAERRSDGARVEFFTNGKGVFNAYGLSPGEWTLIITGKVPPMTIGITLDDEGGFVRMLGDLKEGAQ